jgi:hypothetical protein
MRRLVVGLIVNLKKHSNFRIDCIQLEPDDPEQRLDI